MPEINASFRFSWEPATWAQSFKALFRNPSPAPSWFKDLEQFDMAAFTKVREKGSPRTASDEKADKSPEDYNILLKTVVYLTRYPHPRLESILKEKFEKLSTAESLKNAFHSILLLSLRTNRPKMLEVCQKVLSSQKLADLFRVKDVMGLAKKEALVVSKPENKVTSLSKALIQSLQQPLLKILRIIRYIFSTTKQAYGVDFNTPPVGPQRAQGQWTFYRDTLHDICVLVPLVKTFCADRWKTSIIVATVIGVSIAAAYRLTESPSRKAMPFGKTEFVFRTMESDDVQQCHTHPDSPIKREPSSELESCLQGLEHRLIYLNENKALTIALSNQEREANPYWTETERGIKLAGDLENINRDIETQQNHLTEIKKLSLRLEKLSQIYFDLREKEHAIIHFLNDQTKNNNTLEVAHKNYQFLKFLALPEIRREYEVIIAKCKVTLAPPSQDLTGSRLNVRLGIAKSSSTSSLKPSALPPSVLASLTVPAPIVQLPPISRARSLSQHREQLSASVPDSA